jgi:outer membrane immunogenic protein
MSILARFGRSCLVIAAWALAGTAPAAAQNYDASGLLRIGAFVQGSWIDGDFRVVAAGPPATTTTGTASLDGFGGGISFGYDHRFGGMILGVEADASFDNASKRVAVVDVGVDYFATFRGRLGVNLHPGVLVYGTAGLALLGGEGEATFGGVSTKVSRTFSGVTYGGGIEIDWSHLTFFVEYLHSDFGVETIGVGVGNSARIDLEDDTIRVGLKFKYGHDHAHDRGYGKPLK